MGLAGIVVAVLVALIVAAVMAWGAFGALVRAGRFLWRLLAKAK